MLEGVGTVRPDPRARRSSHAPVFVKVSRPVDGVPAPAVNTWGYAPGASACVRPSFPDGATTSTPASKAWAIASVSTWLSGGGAWAPAPGEELLIPRAPVGTAAVIACTTTPLELLRVDLKMRTEKTGLRGDPPCIAPGAPAAT